MTQNLSEIVLSHMEAHSTAVDIEAYFHHYFISTSSKTYDSYNTNINWLFNYVSVDNLFEFVIFTAWKHFTFQE